ncbi:hypothetical protein KEK_20888 [Mycolicibacterium thermoresistibile ATCC 19527]|uniref:Uncharacterized protein n=2 Tax=Mycolicibacterium thermoresistibile TaxID=1797 RepID=G7CMD1_MYCT3|nr:hypothetical protein KEK_20888 [Mycolicibacterium thermoresistibile ATCC 19527]GAT17046.1 putative uncharacterized protein [Mycolicibacterium thermoresistibile]
MGEFAAPPDSVIAMGAPPDAATPNWSAQLTDATTGREFTPLAVPHRARHIDILRTRNRAQQQHPSAERKSGLRHRITRFGRRSRFRSPLPTIDVPEVAGLPRVREPPGATGSRAVDESPR